MPQFEQVTVIVNPASGQDQPILNTLNRAFSGSGIRWAVEITHQAGDGARLAQAAVDAGADLVAVYGGDGTVMDVANGLIGHDVPLAILPGGTGNVKAIELGIPLQLDQAAALMTQGGKLRLIDAGRVVDGPHFLLNAGVGVFTDIMAESSRELKDRYGYLAYVMTALRIIPQDSVFRYHLTLDGETLDTEGFAVFVANSGSLGWVNVSPKISPNDGQLDAFILSQKPAALVSMAARLLNINIEELTRALNHHPVRDITIESDPPQTLQLDGEVMDIQTPVTLRVVPDALKVLVPDEET